MVPPQESGGGTPHPRVSAEVLEYKIASIAEDVREIKGEYKELKVFISSKFNELERNAAGKFDQLEQREKQWYKWAMGALFWIITILVGVLWLYRAVIIGTTPGS